VNAAKLIQILPLPDQQRILLSLLPDSLDHTAIEFFQCLENAARETTTPLDFWNSLTEVLHTHFAHPPLDDPIACINFRGPTPESTNSLFTILNLLHPRIPAIPDPIRLFKVITHDILFNKLVCYDPSPQMFSFLSFLTTLLPDEARTLLQMVSDMQQELLSIECLPITHSPSPRGIKNLGATCYMNATIQQLFHIPHFRNCLLSASFDGDDWNVHFQYAFAQLLFFVTPSIDISPFVSHWKGWGDVPVNPREHQDAVEFLQALLEKIESFMPSIVECFRGRLKSVVRSPADESLSSETDQPFLVLQLDVKQCRTVDDSFTAFLAPDHYEEYTFDGGRKAEANRFT
jgi:hypothetical protein